MSLSNPVLGNEERGQGCVRPLIDAPFDDGQHGTIDTLSGPRKTGARVTATTNHGEWDRTGRTLQVPVGDPTGLGLSSTGTEQWRGREQREAFPLGTWWWAPWMSILMRPWGRVAPLLGGSKTRNWSLSGDAGVRKLHTLGFTVKWNSTRLRLGPSCFDRVFR